MIIPIIEQYTGVGTVHMTDELEASLCVKIAACVCGKDGLISEIEEKAMFAIVSARYSELTQFQYEQFIDDFFDSNEHIEEYLSQVRDPSLQKFILKLSEESAASDGLDVRENIVLQKIQSIWE